MPPTSQSDASISLAIETSSRVGSVSLGRGEELLESREVPPPDRAQQRIDLMPTIARLCAAHRLAPVDLSQVIVSIGPGSFTGLRIAVATAKMLALSLGVKIIAVPSVDVLACSASPAAAPANLAVGLNLKRDRFWCGLYEHRQGWQPLRPPELLSMDELLSRSPRPLAILGDPLPPVPQTPGVTLLSPALAIPRSEHLWRLGRHSAAAQRFVAPLELTALYVRPPEAVELWKRRRPSS